MTERARHDRAVLELFPESATVEKGELAIGGRSAASLAEEFGTPLVVYCERTLRAQARAYRSAAPDALVIYGAKAFPNVALLRLFAEEGLGADVSTLGELRFALAAGVPGERLVVHGNNKSDEELRAAAGAAAGLVVLDAPDEVERAARAGVRRVLVRVTSGIEADTHDAIRTGHHGSKFGLPPDEAIAAIARAREARLEAAGLHVHVGSQLLDTQAARMTVEWLAAFAAECRAALGWTPAVVDVGGGLGVRHVEDERAPAVDEFVGELVARLEHAWDLHGLPRARLVLEPGRSLVGRAGMTLYRVGVVKVTREAAAWVAVDGGMSDNPRPQLYGARYTALLANRAGEERAGAYSVTGPHCEEEVVIRHVALPEPRRGDLLAVPATGAYTLAMASNYNVAPRPAAVLVADGRARLIRRRETLDDLLAREVDG
ncbi:MAG: diaminopimelate decarboxylase [Thermoleophilia bacterium]|nr:diaminopimelate decarboxylase [Thermoleophilia bacterium]